MKQNNKTNKFFKLKRNLLFLVVIITFHSCTEKEVMETPIETSDKGHIVDAIIPKTTKLIDQNNWSKLNVKHDTTNNTVVLDKSENLHIEEGDILTSTEGDGMLLKVEKIEDANGKLNMKVSQASFEEAIEEVDANFDIPIDFSEEEDLGSGICSEGVKLNSFTSKKKIKGKIGKRLSLSIDKTLENEKFPGFSVGLKGTIWMDNGIQFYLKIKKRKLRKLKVGYSGGVGYNLQAFASGDFSEENKKIIPFEKRIYKKNFKKKVFWTGWIPHVIRPVLRIYVGTRASIQASISSNGSISYGAGVQYKRGDGWDTYADFSKEFNLAQIRLKGGIEVYVRAVYSYKIDGVLSPSVSGEIGGGIKGQYEFNPFDINKFFKFDTYVSCKVDTEMSVKVFKKELIDKDYSLVSVTSKFYKNPEKAKCLFPKNNSKIKFSETAKIQWIGYDKDINDELKYDIKVTDQNNNIILDKRNFEKTKCYIKNLKPSTTYFWTVKSIDKQGKSKLSDRFSFTTESEIKPLVAPLELSPNNTSKGLDPENLTFEWKSTNDGDCQYDIYLEENGNYQKLTTVNGNSSVKAYSYKLTKNLNPLSTYKWKVIVRRGDEESSSAINYFTTLVKDAVAFVDKRDQKEYAAIKIGDKYWMAEVLTYQNSSFGNKIKNANNIAYYSSNIVNSVCPEGWKIPSSNDAEQLFENNGYSPINLMKKSMDDNATNSTGFSAIKTGMYESNTFKDPNLSIFLYKNNGQNVADGEYSSLIMGYGDMWHGDAQDQHLIPVRCIKK